MKDALAWLMASRWRATLFVVLFTVMPLAGILGAAVLALVVLRHGLKDAVTVAGLAAVALLAMYLALGMAPAQVLGTVAIIWLPVMALAAVLQATGSQGRTLALAAILGCGAVAGIFAATGDPAAAWEEVLREHMVPLFERAGVTFDRDTLEEAVPAMSQLMTGLAAAFWAVGHFITVALGRWAQAVLHNPGGFRSEFHGLRLGLVAVAASGLLFIGATLAESALLGNLALVLVLVYAVQGIAVLHGVVGGAKLHWAWLVPPYALLALLPPHMVALLAVMGYLDYWVDFRRRFTATV